MNYITFFKSRLQSIVIRLTCFLIFSCLLFSSAFSIPAGFLTAQASLVPGDVHSEENLSDEKKLSSEEDPSNSENLSVDKNLSSEEDLNIEDGTPGEDLSPEDYISGEIPDSDVFDENRSDETDPLNEYKEEYEEDPGDEWPTTWPEDGITARIPRPDFDMDSLEVNICMENDFMGTLNATEEDYESYLLSCRDYGFSSEEETHSSHEGDFYSAGFSAFDIDGYKITLEYYSFNDPEADFPGRLSIRIKAPIQLGTLNWPDHALGLLIPQPPTSVGGAGGDPEIFLRASLGDMPIEAWREYVEACREAGFDQNISETEREYTATDEYGIRLTLSYSGGNMVDLILFDPEQKWRSRGLGDSQAGGGEGEDGSGTPGEPDSPDPDSFGANEPEETDGPDSTEKPDAPDSNSFGADGTERTDDPDGTENPDETDKTNGIDDPNGADALNGTENPGGTDKTPGENTGTPGNDNPGTNDHPADQLDGDIGANQDTNAGGQLDSGASMQFDSETSEENKGEMYEQADDSLNEEADNTVEDSPIQDSLDEYNEYILDDQGSLIPEESDPESSNTPDSVYDPDLTESGQAAKDHGEVFAKESEKKRGDNLPLIPADGRILVSGNADAQGREQYVQTLGQSSNSLLPANSTGSAYILSGPAARKLEAALRGSPDDALLIRSDIMIRSGQYGKEAQDTGRFQISGRNSRKAHFPESGITLPGEETRTAAALAGILAAASVLAGAVVKWRMFIRSLR